MLSGSKGEVRGGNQYNSGEHRDTTSTWSSVISFDFKSGTNVVLNFFFFNILLVYF